MTIDPRVRAYTMPGRSTRRDFTDQAYIALLAPSAERREVLGELHEGWVARGWEGGVYSIFIHAWP